MPCFAENDIYIFNFSFYTQGVLKNIEIHGLVSTISNLRKRKLLKIVNGMSIFLKVGDPRRFDDTLHKVSITINIKLKGNIIKLEC